MRKPSDAAEPPHSNAQAPAPHTDDASSSSGARPMPAETGAALPAASIGPLAAHDFELLERAGARARGLRRALWLANANGGTLLVCAFACLPFALFADAWLLLPALALAASGAVELRGARMLQRFDLRAPRWLAINQLALLALIALYCGASVLRALRAPSVVGELASSAPELADQLRDAASGLGLTEDVFDSGYRTAVVLFYAAVFGACAIYQGFCAHYYRTRAALLRAYVEETPAWVREAQRRLTG